MNRSNLAAGETSTLMAALLLCGVGLIFIAHMALFLLYGAPSALEGVYRPGQPRPGFGIVFDLFYVLMRTGHHDAPQSFRLFSAVCAAATLLLVYRLANRWSGDAPSGAALTLGLILFPTATYAFALAIPHALLALIFALSLTLVAEAPVRKVSALLATAGVLCASLPFIHSAGYALSAVVLGVALLERDVRRELFWFLGVAGIAVALMFAFALFGDRSSANIASGLRSAEELASIFQGYAMIWVAQVFSIMAVAGSRALRLRLGRRGVLRAIMFLVSSGVATASLVLVPIPAEESLNVAFSGVLVVGVLASLPMVMWIRLIMPQVRSVAIWIALPVIMYSCFWVVLGPIDLDGFPYDQLRDESVFSASQLPG